MFFVGGSNWVVKSMWRQCRVPAPRRLLVGVAAAQVIASVRKQCAYALTAPCIPHHCLPRASPSILFKLHRPCSKKTVKKPVIFPFGLRKKLLRRVLRRRLLRRLDRSVSQAQTAWDGKINECNARNSKNNNEGGKGDTQCASKCCLRKGDTTEDAKGKSRKNTCLKSDEKIVLHSLGADERCRCKVYGVVVSAPPVRSFPTLS